MAAIEPTTNQSAGVDAGLWLLVDEHPDEPRSSLTAAVIRRLLDVAVALVLLVLLLPLCLIIALAIRRDSPGPSIFRQQRVGLRGRKFVLFKFRTMQAQASTDPHRQYVQALIKGESGPSEGNLYKLAIDPRITRVGRSLRHWSLDELPQLINVLHGDMALVGPRPVIPYETTLYPSPYWRRFMVKPGMTGLWQVSGRNACSYDEMVQLDLEYLQRRSLGLDLMILAKTIPVVLKRTGVA